MMREEYANNAGHTLIIDKSATGFEVTITAGDKAKSREFKSASLARSFARIAMSHPKSGDWRELESQWATDYRTEQGTY